MYNPFGNMYDTTMESDDSAFSDSDKDPTYTITEEDRQTEAEDLELDYDFEKEYTGYDRDTVKTTCETNNYRIHNDGAVDPENNQFVYSYQSNFKMTGSRAGDRSKYGEKCKEDSELHHGPLLAGTPPQCHLYEVNKHFHHLFSHKGGVYQYNQRYYPKYK